MATPPQIVEPFDAERALLAAVCRLAANDPRRVEIQSRLTNFPWQSIDHRIIYETLADGRLGSLDVPARLAARLTQLGFPDIELEFCFEGNEHSVDAALAWLRAQKADEGRGVGSAKRASGTPEPGPLPR